MIEGAARLIVPGNDETLGLEPRAAQTQVFGTGTPNGIRTRAATLRGWCPRPLDDGGRTPGDDSSTDLGRSLECHHPQISCLELGGEDSNPQ